MVVEILAGYFVQLIQQMGYFGIFILMTLESMVAPVPSELVMPFAGYVAALGQLDFVGINLAALAGSLVGSLISFFAGKYLGRALVVRYGKWLGLHESHLHWTEKWFAQHGSLAVFVGRFIPVVRHLISIPAGLSEMPKREFIAMTFLGAVIWNGFLAYAGFALKDQYHLISQYSSGLDAFVVLVLAFAFVYWLKRRAVKRGSHSHA